MRQYLRFFLLLGQQHDNKHPLAEPLFVKTTKKQIDLIKRGGPSSVGLEFVHGILPAVPVQVEPFLWAKGISVFL